MPRSTAPAADQVAARPTARRADIQGLRALAVSLVIGFHLGLPGLRGGFVGVDVFFAVSGFVITSLLLREQQRGGAISVLGFYARRARRILPAATLVALATMLATYLWLGYLAGNRVADVARWASVFAANFHLYWNGTSYFNAADPVSPLLHYWSLGVEEQFYLVVPVLALAAGATARRFGRVEPRHLMATVVALVTLASLYLSVSRSASSPTYAYLLPYTRAWELGAGALLALLAPAPKVPRTLAVAASWLGLGLVAFAAASFGPGTTYPGVAALAPVLGTVLVIAVGRSPAQVSANGLLALRPATWLGDRSFSLYLVSFPVLTITAEASGHRLGRAEQLLLLALSVVLASACWRFVEQPVRSSPRLQASVKASLALGAGLVLVGLLLPTLAIAAHRDPRGPWKRPPAPASLPALERELNRAAQQRQLPDRVDPALSQVATASTTFVDPALDPACLLPRGSMHPPTCTAGARGSSRHAVLVGDSTAAMWSAAASVAANQRGLALTLMAKMACAPFAAPGAGDLSQGDASCPRWRAELPGRIAALRPELVIVAASRGDLRVPEARRNAANARGLATFAARLVAGGAEVVVLGPAPSYAQGWAGSPPPDCLAQHHDDLLACTQRRDAVVQGDAASSAAMVQAARSAGARFLPVVDLLCGADRCPVVVGQRLVYYNKSHLSAPYSRYVGRAFGDLLG